MLPTHFNYLFFHIFSLSVRIFGRMAATFIERLIASFLEPGLPVVEGLAAHMRFGAGFRDISCFLPCLEQQMPLLWGSGREISTFLFHALHLTSAFFRVHPHLAQYKKVLIGWDLR